MSVEFSLLEITLRLVARRKWPAASREIKINMVSTKVNVSNDKV